MVRTQIQLTKEQADALRRIAIQEGTSMAEIVRRAVNDVIRSDVSPDRDELKRRALAAVGSVRSRVKDLSTKHDEYLAEAVSK